MAEKHHSTRIAQRRRLTQIGDSLQKDMTKLIEFSVMYRGEYPDLSDQADEIAISLSLQKEALWELRSKF